MVKTVKVMRMRDAREDNSWALKLSDAERIEIATRLTRDLWCAAHGGSFPTMNRQIVRFGRRLQDGLRGDPEK